MGRFAQIGLCYSFEILQGLLSNKKIRNSMKKIFGESPLHPQLTLFCPEFVFTKFKIDQNVLQKESFSYSENLR